MAARRIRAGGFTLLELMIVVAIIGLLAAIAIPNFLRFQLKSKTSEAKANIAAIRTAEYGYQATFGSYASASASPANNGGSTKQTFAATDPPGSGFDLLGWAPEGRIFFNYAVTASGSDGGSFTIDASADLDDDGVDQVWGYVHATRGGATLVGDLGCTGVWNGVAAISTSTVGPCGAGFGNSEF